MGPDKGKHLRNIAILCLLAVGIWQLPGGNTGAALISNLLTLMFVGGLLFFGFRLYMENRDTIFGLEERQRGILYAAVALIAVALVATARMWDAGGLGAMVWLLMIGTGIYAIYAVWRAYRTY